MAIALVLGAHHAMESTPPTFPASSPAPDDDLEKYLEDPQAWSQASRSLQRVAFSVVGDDSSADDIVQSAWLEVLRRKPKGKGLGWIRMLVRHRSIDAYRKRLSAPLTQSNQSIDALEGVDPAQVESRLEIQSAVLDAVRRLDEPYRSTIFLRYFEGLGPSAIAKRLDLPEKTVKARLLRGKQKLRESLRPRWQDRGGGWSPALLGFAGSSASPAPLVLPTTATTLIMKKAVAALLVLFIGWGAYKWNDSRPGAEVDSLAQDSGAEAAATQDPIEIAAITNQGDQREVLQEEPQAEADPKPLVNATYGSLQVAVLAANDTPATEVHVTATLRLDSRRKGRRFRALTTPLGIATFEALPPGNFEVTTNRTDNWKTAKVNVVAGERTDLEIQLPQGVHVTGRVVDQNRRPVANASVWLTARTSSWTGGSVATRSDSLGHFELHHVPAGQSIGALAQGFLRSELTDLDLLDTTTQAVDVEVILTPGGATLKGQVTDVQGSPIAGAQVAIGKNSSRSNMRADQSFQEDWSPRVVQADAQGHFEAIGLPKGTHPVQARSLEHPLWESKIELKSGLTTELNITLKDGVSVRGTVTNDEGDLVANATLFAVHEQLPESYLQGGQIDYEGAFAMSSTLSAEDGTYLLPNLSPGSMWLYALEPPKESNRLFADIRFTRELTAISPGPDNEWNPVLSAGRAIQGAAVYNDGAPIEGMFIILKGPKKGEERAIHSKDGKFRFVSLGQGPYSIRVQIWDLPKGHEEPRLVDVYPSENSVEIVASFDSPKVIKPIRVSVKFVDTGKRCTKAPTVLLEEINGRSRSGGQKVDGVWTFETDKPGRYLPIVLADNRLVAMGRPFEVHGGENLKLPDIHSGPGGSLRLHFDFPDVDIDFNVNGHITIDPEKWGESFIVHKREEMSLDNLEPGTGTLTFYGTGVTYIKVPFEVVAGQETQVTVPLVGASPVRYRLEWPNSEASGSMLIEFIDRSTGAVIETKDFDDLALLSSPIDWTYNMPKGAYTFRVTKNGEPFHTEDFDVVSLNPDDAPFIGMRP